MNEVSASVIVDAPAERVYELVDQWDRLASVHPRLQLRPVDDGPDRGLGARFRGDLALSPMNAVLVQSTFEVADHYFPERLVLADTGGEMQLEFTFGRVGQRTLVELRQRFKLPGGPVGRLVGSALSVSVQRDVSEALQRLKRLAEG